MTNSTRRCPEILPQKLEELGFQTCLDSTYGPVWNRFDVYDAHDYAARYALAILSASDRPMILGHPSRHPKDASVVFLDLYNLPSGRDHEPPHKDLLTEEPVYYYAYLSLMHWSLHAMEANEASRIGQDKLLAKHSLRLAFCLRRLVDQFSGAKLEQLARAYALRDRLDASPEKAEAEFQKSYSARTNIYARANSLIFGHIASKP